MATSVRDSTNLMDTGAAIMNQKTHQHHNRHESLNTRQSQDKLTGGGNQQPKQFNNTYSQSRAFSSSHYVPPNIPSPISNALNSHANNFNTGRYTVTNYHTNAFAPPKKQGKMFHINLGQNDGPYKRTEVYGQPHVDKFASTSMLKDQKKQGGARIAILGGTTFAASEDHKSRGVPDEPTNSVNKQIKHIEEQLVVGYEVLAAFKADSEELRVETDVLMNELITKIEAVQTQLSPELYNDYKTLKAHMKEQKEENEIQYKELLALKREGDTAKTKIAACMERINQLEANVGIMANNPNYNPPLSSDNNQSMPTNLKQVSDEPTHAE